MTEVNNTSNGSASNEKATDAAERHAGNAANALDAKLSGPLAPLEESLDSIFGSKASFQLPADIKKLLVTIAPWLSLLAGVMGIFAAYGLWQAANYVNELSRNANDWYQAAGLGIQANAPQLGVIFWLSIVMTLVFAALALLAFPGLRAHKKVGWNLMFYSMLANIAYGIVSLFYENGGFGSLLGALIGSAIGLYILFQIRGSYLEKATAA